MSKFRHPHLTRGTVYTSTGAFVVRRGVIDAPDHVGQEFGWLRIDEEVTPDLRTGESAAGQQTTERRVAG